MNFIRNTCGCFHCPLYSDKGSYNSYDRERRQKDGQHPTIMNTPEQLGTNDGQLSQQDTEQAEQTSSSCSGIDCGHNPNSDHQLPHQLEKTKTMRSGRTDRPVLSSFTLEGIAELINDNKIGKASVVVLVGAGMSTAAGVPDFRSPDTGIYANLQKYNLPNPEDVFKISYFKNNPAPFYDLSKSLLPTKLYPTISHYFIRLLHEKGYLLRCFSQNVDCLESASGLPKDKFCLAHGSFETGHCLRCNAEYGFAWMRKIVEEGGIPHCTKTPDCKGLIKPDIKFFGERLDARFFRLIREDTAKCELLIIIGSSLSVMPFAQIVEKVPPQCPRLLINKTKSGHNIPAIFRLFKPTGGLMYDRKGNTRDVAYIGNCDDACLKLASYLGWNGELIDMAKSRRSELEQTTDGEVS